MEQTDYQFNLVQASLHIWLKAIELEDIFWIRGFFVVDDVEHTRIRDGSNLIPPWGFFDNSPRLYLKYAP